MWKKICHYSFSMLVFIFLSGQSQAGEFSLNQDNQLQFDGLIEDGDFEKLKALNLQKTDKLKIRSFGGDVETAIDIANYLLDRKIHTIEIQEYCFSSCANYLLTAAQVKIITNSIVGFHGAAFNAKFDEEKLNKNDQYLRKLIKKESEFFERINLSKKFFSESYKSEKIVEDGKHFHFWTLSPSKLAMYGIDQVIGEYDQDIVSKQQFQGKFFRYID